MNNSWKKILAGVDLGPDTERIAAYTVWLARSTGAQAVCLLHVVDFGLTPPSYVVPYLDKERARLDGEISQWVDKLRKAGMEAQGKIEVGRLVEAFHSAINSYGPDAIVLGHRSHLLRASSSERLIKSLSVPLLVVRGKKSAEATPEAVEVKTVLCAIDFSDHSFKAFELAKRLAVTGGAQLVIVHALKPLPEGFALNENIRKRYQEERREEAGRRLEPLAAGDTAVRSVIGSGSPYDVITRVAEETGASLLVMGARGLSRFKGILLGSVSGALIKSSSCPVMIVH